jgi:GT2 family glycosyltransferase
MADHAPDPDPWEQVGALRDRVADLEAANERLLRRVSGIAEEAARSAERNRLNAAEAAALRKRLAFAESRVEALIASTSWRMTQPLRVVVGPLARASGLRRGVGPARAAPAAIPARTGPARRFPLAGDVAAHPALLDDPVAPLSASVSVIIPTWNAGRELGWLLRKLRAQRGLGGLEIIVVDSGSTDGTPDLAAALGCRVVPIDRAAFSHSAARNLGASLATGDLLLFMVQDAYPIGDDWLAGLARALLHPAREEDRLAALSCAEFCRADSEMIYDHMARGHYEFLGCADADRIGRLTTADQDGLRRQGQLSDVACLIPRALFETFLFHGRYAEDLTLGIRLIEAGHQLGMLSSIRVAHSHNRPASYYVRRVFVDVVFLVEVFSDFPFPPHHDAVGVVVAAAALWPLVAPIRASAGDPPARALERVIDRLRATRPPRVTEVEPADAAFGLAPLADWIGRLLVARDERGRGLTPAEARGAEALRDTVVARLTALHHYVAETWTVADAVAMAELDAAARKTLAMSLGAQLAFCHLADARRGGGDPLLAELRPLLLAGI